MCQSSKYLFHLLVDTAHDTEEYTLFTAVVF